MKIQFKKLLSSVPYYRELQELRFPPKISLDLYKQGKDIDRELETYREMLRGIYKNYNVPESPEGFNLSKLDKNQFPALTADLEELLDSEAEVRDVSIPLEVFERFDLNISASMLNSLDWVIKDGEVSLEEPKVEDTNYAN